MAGGMTSGSSYLHEEIREVLVRLSTLSEAPASNFEPRTSQSAPGSIVPMGASLRRDGRRPPPKDRSLFDWYVWQFQDAAEEPQRLLSLYLLAEREYQERRFHDARRVGLRKGALTENDVQDGGAAERAAAERVIDWYEGLSALEVAINERTTEVWVKKARRQNGRNPDDGRPLPEFYGWDEDARAAKVRLLAETMSQGKAADHLGVDRKTVSRYWPVELAALPGRIVSALGDLGGVLVGAAPSTSAGHRGGHRRARHRGRRL